MAFKRLFLAALAFSILSFSAFAQPGPAPARQYPQNIFRYPLDLPPSTAGGFAELRSNHFHSGLDFRTNQREGYPVHAAYDGYVSRIRVQFGGFGNALYITHPNGFTSVYGHLQRFSPEILQALRAEQKRQQKDVVDFSPNPLQFPVYKGQIVAWSGNTGGSAGPHLHFELRDSETEQTINPQLFGLTIPDRVPPTIMSVAVYHLNGAPFSEKTEKAIFQVTGAGGNYHPVHPSVLEIGEEAAMGIAVNDMNSASANRNGAFSIQLLLDGKSIYTFMAERFAFDQTHAINAYIDYPLFLSSGRWIQKCFILPGSRITVYPQSVNRGLIKLTDDEVHDLQYVVKDVAGNTSMVNLKIKRGLVKAEMPPGAGTTRVNYNQTTVFTRDKLKLTINPYNLYDNLDMTFTELPKRPGAYSAVYKIHNHLTPIHDSINVWIKPDSTLGNLVNKAVIYNTYRGSVGGVYEDGYIKSAPRDFGEFYIRVDTIPPTIRPVNLVNGGSMAGKSKMTFRIGDNLSGIKSYLAKIDGEWVLFEWDFKTKLLNHTFDGTLSSGKHSLELTVTDNKDNTAQYNATFYR
ncbi:M23 family metallopeptidase [Mucilaginibacter ginkgonis]|uniref:M23 family metallopeptidase n=1 Tax=Mucilaginibacter ginkgonis TaxID=2682091 RepID=A0A6I4I5P5_9SPHI|nr:M23 family metallopeptidase [Mucilaginibacter ginkgonis]QQL48498.1 M23 family metallopeptidase [Mucilaginibacter ginkgonis]